MREILIRVRSIYNDNLHDLYTAAPCMPSIIWVCKGFELNSGLLPSQIIQDVLGNVLDGRHSNSSNNNFGNFGALLGPSFAKEVALGLPTAVTLASHNCDFALNLAEQLCKIPNFRVYAHDDLIGSEVSAGVKNIIAIAVGISDGLNLGFNARAALITRSLSELCKLVLLLGGNPNTPYGLSGIGDLILTCTGDLSRNRSVGLELANGFDIDTILLKLGHVAEGVYATQEVYNMSKPLGIEMPIVAAVYNIIYNKHNIKQTVFNLLNRESKYEF